jgi:outer membrane protein OmpA-like peptidoglycan-associated protein
MSPAVLRAIFGSCLTLGLADLAWLDANAEKVGQHTSSPPLVLVEPAMSAAPPRPVDEAPPVRVRERPVSTTTAEALPAGAPEKAAKREERFASCVIQFERSLSVIPPDQAADLAAIAEATKNDPRAIVKISGHADRMAWKANRGDNLTLSEDRALAVARALGKLGIPAGRIRRVAFADTRPVDDRATEEAYRRNRRVEVRVEPNGER